MTSNRKSPPLVILGLDAGDPDFILRWAQEGYLPTTASIMQRGCWAKTAGPELITEHGVWVPLLSGLSRVEHGAYYFRELKPGTYDLQLVTGYNPDAPPFWSDLLGHEKKIAIIDAPDIPPIAGLPGLQLANWATHNNWTPLKYPMASEPPELLHQVQRDFGPKLVARENEKSSLREDQQIYEQLCNHITKKADLCRHLLAQDSFDLVVIVFAESHVAGHQFWKYHLGAEPAQSGLAHAIRDVYQAIDREMGRLLAQLPAEANVFILSSVGMVDKFPTTGLVEAFFRQLGYQAAPASSGVSWRPLDLARRIVPEAWRIALSRRFPREMRERWLADQFRRGTDWTRTTAFAIPSSYTSFVRVNLRGREPQGIVNPGAEYRALLDRLEADFKQLVDPETNEPAVTQVEKTVELFQCDPPRGLPDLFVVWKSGRFMPRVAHPRTELVQTKPDFYRRSDHSTNGFVAAAGPQIQSRGAMGEVSILDFAPTCLTLMGEPVPPRMRGRIMREMIGS